MFHYFSEDNLSTQNGQSAMITTKNWLLLMCLGFIAIIPIIGLIAYIVIYLMLAFNTETAKSIANYIKAQLLIALISTVLAGVIVALSFGTMLQMML